MNKLQHTRSVILAALLLACGAAAQDGTDSAMPTYRSNAAEVRVTFFATAKDGRAVENLAATDVAVVDSERVVRNFRSFTRSDEAALDIVALVDLSESVAPRFRAAMNGVLQLIAREQSLPEDSISVLSFGGVRPAVVCSRGCRDGNAAARLLNVKASGLTPLYDAMVFGADYVNQHRRPGVRPVVILFSDGNDTISMRTSREAVEAFIDSGAVVYTVDIAATRTATDGGRFLRWLADATGGRYFSLNDGAATVLKAVLDDLRASYVLTYALPDRQAGLHSLRLMPTRDLNLKFHSRTSYHYEFSIR